MTHRGSCQPPIICDSVKKKTGQKISWAAGELSQTSRSSAILAGNGSSHGESVLPAAPSVSQGNSQRIPGEWGPGEGDRALWPAKGGINCSDGKPK